MAIPPTIPTSFVPKQPVTTTARRPQSGLNAFLIIGGVVAGIAVIGSLATFGYKYYLEGQRTAKAAELERAQREINLDTVEGFIRLRSRLASTRTLLDQHVLLSQFLDTLETKTLQTVRFSSLKFTVSEDRSAEIEMDGTARSFNALAAQSEAFASEKRIKRAIFSDITVNTDGTVAFTLSAELDPRLIISNGSAPVPASPESTLPVSVPPQATTPVATSTPAATTPATASTTPRTTP